MEPFGGIAEFAGDECGLSEVVRDFLPRPHRREALQVRDPIRELHGLHPLGRGLEASNAFSKLFHLRDRLGLAFDLFLREEADRIGNLGTELTQEVIVVRDSILDRVVQDRGDRSVLELPLRESRVVDHLICCVDAVEDVGNVLVPLPHLIAVCHHREEDGLVDASVCIRAGCRHNFLLSCQKTILPPS